MADTRYVIVNTYKDDRPRAVDSEGAPQPRKGFLTKALAAEWFAEANIHKLHMGPLDAEGSQYVIAEV